MIERLRVYGVKSLILLWLVIVLVTKQVNADKEMSTTRTYKIYHSVQHDDAVFTPRGEITLSPSSTGTELEAEMKHDDDCLVSIRDEIDMLVTVGGLYRIKLVDEETGRSAIASVPSCEIRRANFREEITLTVGHTGSLMSISYIPVVSPLARACSDIPSLASFESDEIKFSSTVTVSAINNGMTIPLVLPTSKPPQGFSWFPRTQNGNNNNPFTKPETEGTDDTQHQSFLRRYWYIILPVIIMTSLGGSEDGAGSNRQTVGSASSGTSQTVESSVRQRRDKRG